MHAINTSQQLSHPGLRTEPISSRCPFIMAATCHLEPWCAPGCWAQSHSLQAVCWQPFRMLQRPLLKDSYISGTHQKNGKVQILKGELLLVK